MLFSSFEYHIFYVLYPFVTHLLTIPRIFVKHLRKAGKWRSTNLVVETGLTTFYCKKLDTIRDAYRTHVSKTLTTQ
jgi:hypothetical protein